MSARLCKVVWPFLHVMIGTPIWVNGEPRVEFLLFMKQGAVYRAPVVDEVGNVERISPKDLTVLGHLGTPTGISLWWFRAGQGVPRAALCLVPDGPDARLFDLPRQPRVTDIVALSSGGDRLAYVLHENASFTIHCLDLKLGKDALLVTGSGWLLSLSWSPNDKAIAYYSAKQRGGNEGSSVSLRVLEVPSGRNKQVAPESKKTRLGGESRFPPVWSSDGESIFIEARYGDAPPAYHVYQVDDEGETAPVYITSGLCTSVYNDVLYVADGGVFTVNLTNGRREVLSTKGTFPRISPSGQAIAFASSDGIYCKPLRKGAVAKVSSGSWPDEFGGYCGYFWTAAADLSQSVQAKPQTPVTPK